ncbi:Hypothetical protein A7982_06953 [Minicystis rosea]|nr:Hypothetical protein A7982_06953 [Minicystis rosea]
MSRAGAPSFAPAMMTPAALGSTDTDARDAMTGERARRR